MEDCTRDKIYFSDVETGKFQDNNIINTIAADGRGADYVE